MNWKSSFKEIAFPAVLTGDAATLIAFQHQFNESQGWPEDKLRSCQFDQLTILVNHSMNIPHYAKNLKSVGFTRGQKMTPEIWKKIPILKRSDLRDKGKELESNYPKSFGSRGEARSGGSTGIPVRVVKTSMGIVWHSCHIREMFWYGIDTTKEILNIKSNAEAFRKNPETEIDEECVILKNWGMPFSLITDTGKTSIVEPENSVDVQAKFILKRQPPYLVMRPAGLRLLLSYFRENEIKVDCIKAILTMSELVDDTLRKLCWEVFGCPIWNNYTSNETGYIALQCPQGTNYHIMSETIYVEVVNEQGDPCKVGEIGRVLVTPLHNFAMPLLRYEIGDEAEVGPPCSCGRTLPSLTRIVGRAEDYFVFENGLRKRVDLIHYNICEIEAIKEFQLIQKSTQKIKLLLVTSRSLNEEETEKLNYVKEHSIAKDLEWEFVFVDSIPRTPSGKLLQFISEVNGTCSDTPINKNT